MTCLSQNARGTLTPRKIQGINRMQTSKTVLSSTLYALIALVNLSCAAVAQESSASCSAPSALRPGAFDEPMTFSAATNKGNMSTSAWISATGKIGPETPARFEAFLKRGGYPLGQIVLHSPGGNLVAGLELGRMIREAGLTAHIGKTRRAFEGYDEPCNTWWDEIEAGACASSCAYAFLGGKERFVDSPYYPTGPNLLGFHQFYGSPERGADMLTSDQVAEIESSTLSVAQALTGQIVLYAIEMGIDPRIVAFASSTPSEDLYYPTPTELDEFSIASGEGLRPWFMEPYADGLVTAAKPHRSDSMMEQITAFCRKGDGAPHFLITMDLQTPSYPNPNDLPLHAVEIFIDGQVHTIARHRLDVRYGGPSIYITVPVGPLEDRIARAVELGFRLEAARVMGGFREGRKLDEIARQSLALAWQNCI